jgi:hypothetical protein
MEISDQEMIRRALSSIVKRIESGGSPPVVLSHQTDQSTTNGNDRLEATEPPIVLVFLGHTVSTNQEPVHEKQSSHPSSVSHPGFEKFQLQESRAVDAPKTCFMEPDRICVNSGACEMLGH